MRAAISVVALLVIGVVPAAAAPRFRVQFFHDEDRSRLQINDLKFCSADRAIASGVLIRDREQDGAALVTRNGGRDWQFVELREPGGAIFCLDESHIWMVGPSGIWFSNEGGLSWRKIHSQRGLLDIYFTSADRGWAVGLPKLALETRDGGKTWQRVEAAAAPKTTAQRTVYSTIAFATPKRGMIVGRSVPPRRWTDSDLPIWMEPEPSLRRQEPQVSIMLETPDGGDTWTHSTVSMFGFVSRVELGADARGLGLIRFDGTFAHPAEVQRLDLKTGKSERTLADKTFAVTDVALVPGGPAYVAGYHAPGLTAWSPVPGRVRVMRSADLRSWTELEVDYRAAAKRVILALAPGGSVWLASDIGMILRLDPSP